MNFETASLRDGTPIRLRPVGPDDAARLQDLLAHMSREDVRLRFFAPLRVLGPALAHRLTHPDPARDVAIAALPAAEDAFIGVARLAADPGGASAEYAIAIRTDLKGHGLGYLLLNRILDAARRRGIAEIWGDVLHENEPMLQMNRDLGFRLEAHPDDAGLVRVRKQLTPLPSG